MGSETFEDYVDEIATVMVAELKAHEAEKGGPGAWLDACPDDWLAEARQQLDFLQQTFEDGAPADVLRRAAHACNFVMMAAQTELAAR